MGTSNEMVTLVITKPCMPDDMSQFTTTKYVGKQLVRATHPELGTIHFVRPDPQYIRGYQADRVYVVRPHHLALEVMQEAQCRTMVKQGLLIVVDSVEQIFDPMEQV